MFEMSSLFGKLHWTNLQQIIATRSILYESWLSAQYVFVFIFVGIIRTALPSMDREARQEYIVVIQAKDMGGHMGGLSGTTQVKITLTDVNDNPPKFAQGERIYLFCYKCFTRSLSFSLSLNHPSIFVCLYPCQMLLLSLLPCLGLWWLHITLHWPLHQGRIVCI